MPAKKKTAKKSKAKVKDLKAKKNPKGGINVSNERLTLSGPGFR